MSIRIPEWITARLVYTYHGVHIVMCFLIRRIFRDSILIVVGPQLFVAQYVVRLTEALKLGLSFWIVRILVWVELGA